MLVTCAAAGALLLGGGLAAASPALAQTTDAMICLEGTFANGVCTLPSAQLNQGYEGLLETADSDGGTFTVTGTIPPGMFIPYQYNVEGTILGANVGAGPTQEGTFTFTVSGTNYAEVPIAPMTYQITVTGPPPLTIVLPASGPTLDPGTVGQSYVQGFFLNGGFAPYTWSLVAGHLPPGLKLVSNGAPTYTDNELTGTPTTAGTFTFTMQLTDGHGTQQTQQFSLTINQQSGGHHGRQ